MKKIIIIFLLLLPFTAATHEMDLPTPREVCRNRLLHFVDVVIHFNHILGNEAKVIPDLEGIYLFSKNPDVLLCPLDKTPTQVTSNKNLRTSFLRYESYTEAIEAKIYPSRIPMYFDRESWEGNGRYILFADGLLYWLAEGEFQSALTYVDDQVRVWKAKSFKPYLSQLENRARQGNIDAMLDLGDAYDRGFGTVQSLPQAQHWYQRAAAEGSRRAILALGTLLTQTGKTQNLKEGCEWFKRAAEAGSREGQFNLGVCYARQDLGEGNDAKALSWFEKAAYQGYPPAQYNLAVFHAKGRGTKADLINAFTWIYLAKRLGDPHARENFSILGRSLSEIERYQAKIDAGMKWRSFWRKEDSEKKSP